MIFKFLAVIVTYNPSAERFAECFNSIVNQVDHLLIIDNNSTNKSFLKVTELKQNVSFIFNELNLGLAKNYNKALKYGRDHDYDYLLILDQDTNCAKNMIEEFKKNSSNDYAVLSPLRIHRNKDFDKHLRKINPQDYPHNPIDIITFTINSGTCINLKKIPQNYYYDERFFVSYSEHDFCFYLYQNKLKLARINSAQITVDIGNVSKHIVGKFDWYAKNYSKERLRIDGRDFILYLRKNFFKDPKFSKPFIIGTLWYYWMIIFEKNKFKKYIALSKGLLKGLFTKVS